MFKRSRPQRTLRLQPNRRRNLNNSSNSKKNPEPSPTPIKSMSYTIYSKTSEPRFPFQNRWASSKILSQTMSSGQTVCSSLRPSINWEKTALFLLSCSSSTTLRSVSTVVIKRKTDFLFFRYNVALHFVSAVDIISSHLNPQNRTEIYMFLKNRP